MGWLPMFRPGGMVKVGGAMPSGGLVACSYIQISSLPSLVVPLGRPAHIRIADWSRPISFSRPLCAHSASFWAQPARTSDIRTSMGGKWGRIGISFGVADSDDISVPSCDAEGLGPRLHASSAWIKTWRSTLGCPPLLVFPLVPPGEIIRHVGRDLVLEVGGALFQERQHAFLDVFGAAAGVDAAAVT